MKTENRLQLSMWLSSSTDHCSCSPGSRFAKIVWYHRIPAWLACCLPAGLYALNTAPCTFIFICGSWSVLVLGGSKPPALYNGDKSQLCQPRLVPSSYTRGAADIGGCFYPSRHRPQTKVQIFTIFLISDHAEGFRGERHQLRLHSEHSEWQHHPQKAMARLRQPQQVGKHCKYLTFFK